MKPHIEIKTEDTTQYYDFVGDPNDCDEHIMIPSGRNMTIYGHLLGGNRRIRSVVIPSGVREICGYAFTDCLALERVTLRRGVRRIGSYAFRDCEKLRHINIPSSVRQIASTAFSGCPNLVIEWHESFIHEDGVVYNADKMRIVAVIDPVDLVLPDGITEIAREQFKFCSTLRTIVIPPSVKKIHDMAIYKCEALQEVRLSEGLTSIGDWVFDYCPNLEMINIPESLSIGRGVFSDCPKLKIEWSSRFIEQDGVVYNADKTEIVRVENPVDLVIPQGVRGDICFMHCETLRSVVIPDSVDLASDTFYDTCYDSFAYCTSLEEVTLPEGMTIIVNGLFRECHKLRKVNIPRSIRKIYICAFENCPEELRQEIDAIIKERGIEAVDFYEEQYGGE